MKLPSVYRFYPDDLISNFMHVISTVWLGIVSDWIIFIYKNSPFYSPAPSGNDVSVLCL